VWLPVLEIGLDKLATMKLLSGYVANQLAKHCIPDWFHIQTELVEITTV